MYNYQNKYLKYKSKYLQLKNKINLQGGTKYDDLVTKLSTKSALCSHTSFRQHKGECWNDSIQMLMCFSDEIKEQVQTKLFNLTPQEMIDLAYESKRAKYLAPIYRRGGISSIKFEKRLVKYLTLLQKRLCIHIGDHVSDKLTCMDASLEETCSLDPYNKFMVLDGEYGNDIRPKLIRQLSEKTAIGSAIYGLKVSNVKKPIRGAHGAFLEEQLPLINALSFVFLDNNSVLTTKIVYIDYLTEEDIDNSFGILCIIYAHEMAFYTCNCKHIFYNDTNLETTISNVVHKNIFNWKKILKIALRHKYKIIIVQKYNIPLFELADGKLYMFEQIGDGDGETDYNFILAPIEHQSHSENNVMNWFCLIKKDNISDDNIYEHLEDQIIASEVLNNSIENIKYINGKLNYIDPISMAFRMEKPDVILNLFKSGSDIDFNKTSYNIFYHKVTTLEMAIKKEYVAIVEYLLEKGKNPNELNNERNTMLYLALQTYNKDIVELLLNYGVDPNIKNNKGNPLLVDVIYKENLEIIKLLLEHGADPDLKNKFDDTMLNFAINKGDINIIKLLLEHGADITLCEDSNIKYLSDIIRENVSDSTMLEYAIYINNPNIVKLFIENGSDPNFKNKAGITMLDLAVKKGNQEIIDLLTSSDSVA